MWISSSSVHYSVFKLKEGSLLSYLWYNIAQWSQYTFHTAEVHKKMCTLAFNNHNFGLLQFNSSSTKHFWKIRESYYMCFWVTYSVLNWSKGNCYRRFTGQMKTSPKALIIAWYFLVSQEIQNICHSFAEVTSTISEERFFGMPL